MGHENLLSGSNNGSFGFTNTNAPSASTTFQGSAVCGGSLAACPSSFEQSWANFLLGNDSTFAQASLDVTANVFDNQIEYYGQDTWRVRPNLTITWISRSCFPSTRPDIINSCLQRRRRTKAALRR